jgi:hypothetical protein
MRLYVAFAATTLLAACTTTNAGDTGSNGATVVAQAAPAEPTEAAGAAKVAKTESGAKVKDLDKVRCKYMAVTGSRMGRKICYTEREWKAMEDAAAETMRDIEAQPRPLDETW